MELKLVTRFHVRRPGFCTTGDVHRPSRVRRTSTPEGSQVKIEEVKEKSSTCSFNFGGEKHTLTPYKEFSQPFNSFLTSQL